MLCEPFGGCHAQPVIPQGPRQYCQLWLVDRHLLKMVIDTKDKIHSYKIKFNADHDIVLNAVGCGLVAFSVLGPTCRLTQ